MKLNDIINQTMNWLNDSGKDLDIILSSRIRLARNLQSFPFTNRASNENLKEIIDIVVSGGKYSTPLRSSSFFDVTNLQTLDKQCLVERHVISPDFANKNNPRGVLIGKGEFISIMINEEDHLRIQSLQSGFSINEAWEIITKVDDDLGSNIEFSFSKQFGYITACPTNLGTGLRVSVSAHLPALVITQNIEKVFKNLNSKGITIRGFYGEGTDVLGNIFQISNQITLGMSEEEIIELVERETKRFIKKERDAREKILIEARIQIEDKVNRALGILMKARMLSSIELMSLLSAIRLGTDLDILDAKIERKKLNEIMILAQPAHIQKIEGRVLEPTERDNIRAEIVRKRLGI
jgi:protein arginine kinase